MKSIRAANYEARTFVWDERRERAARLVADGTHTFVSIAEQVGVHHVTIAKWRDHPEFRERVAELAALIAGDVQSYVNAAVVDTKRRSQEIVDALWDVALNSKSAQAKAQALSILSNIAGLTGSGGRGEGNQVNVQINNTQTAANPEAVEIIDLDAPAYEVQVLSDTVRRADIE